MYTIFIEPSIVQYNNHVGQYNNIDDFDLAFEIKTNELEMSPFKYTLNANCDMCHETKQNRI